MFVLLCRHHFFSSFFQKHKIRDEREERDLRDQVAIGKTKERKKERKLTTQLRKLSAKRIKRREMMVSSRLLRKSEKSSPSLVLRNSTPWFFAAICFLWASFLTVAMLSNEQSLESNREQMRREVEERVMNRLVKREKRKRRKIPSLASEYHRREEEDDDDEDKRRTRRIRGPLAGAYRRHGLDEDQVGVQERKVQGPKFRGPFGRLESLIHEKAREKRDLRDEEETTNGARREKRTDRSWMRLAEDTDGKEKPQRYVRRGGEDTRSFGRSD